MQLNLKIALFVTFLAYTGPAESWNAAGHRIISSIAYDHLTPAARVRVDDLIRRHPDFQSHFLRNEPKAPKDDPADRAREAFLAASTWPDEIRNDPRFYDDSQSNAPQTPLLPGFPDMGRHLNWHYTNIPFTQDGTPGPPSPKPNAVTELPRLIDILDKPPGDKANPVYALPWFLHLAGDLHNPLHAVARFSRELPGGDRGGNLVFVEKNQPLHAFWDNLLGTSPALNLVVPLGLRLAREHKGKVSLSRLNDPPEKWAEEGYDFARNAAYKFGESSGSREKSIPLSEGYKQNASQIARQRAVEAGLRIATILNANLR